MIEKATHIIKASGKQEMVKKKGLRIITVFLFCHNQALHEDQPGLSPF